MANQSGRPIAPARKLVAIVLGTLAVFVMVFGLGLSSWAVFVLGLAILALSIALGMVNVVRRGARAWVTGTAQVKAVSDPPVSSAYGRAELQIVVVAPGLPVTEVLVRDPRVPVDKWPRLGETLPVTVDVDDMRRVRIDWSGAPDRGDPPPPGHSYGDPNFTDPLDDYDDDLLGDPEPPPWATRDQQWGLGPDEPPPPPPATGPDPGEVRDLADNTVVVHDTPAGAILEGQWVGHDEPAPLPKRAPRSGPIPSPSPPSDPPPPPPPAAASSRPAGTRPSPRPRPSGAAGGAATATVEPETATSGPFAFSGTRDESTEASAPQANRATAPEQRSSAQPSTPADVRQPNPVPANDEPVLVGEPVLDDEPVARTSTTWASDDEPIARTARASDDEPVASTRTTPVPDDEPVLLDEPVLDDVPRTAGQPRPTAEPRTTDKPAGAGQDPEIDLALDGDPEPAPETTSAAAQAAVASDIIGPPPHRQEPPADDPESAAPAPPAAATAAAAAAATRPDEQDKPADARTPEVSPDDPPVITGLDTAPADDQPQRGPWADLEGGYEPDDRTDEVITAYPSARPGPAGAIHGVGITVLVTNIERSITFYRDMLGFFEIDSGPGSAVLASGDTRVVLRTVDGLSSEAGRLIYLNLEVGDVEAVYEELKAKGVTFVHAPRAVNRGDKLELWSATFTDPDKHNIAISQWRALH